MRERLTSRRDFLIASTAGGLGAFALRAPVEAAGKTKTPVALTAGGNRAENIYRALKLVEEDIRRGLSRAARIVIKPNFVTTRRQLAATHVDCVEGILQFFAPLAKNRDLIIAESPAGAPAAEGYRNYGYYRLKKQYPVKFLDLDDTPAEKVFVIDHRFRPHAVRFSALLCAPDTYVVSAAVMKTHDRAVVTLALKNIAVGGALKQKGFTWGPRRGLTTDKPLVHGGRGNAGIHYNLFRLARFAPPHLAVIDGFRGMQGNGPTSGDPVEHRVAVASCDWVAAERVALELMGVDFSYVGYLMFAARNGLGVGDLGAIEVRGERIQDHVKKYRLHENIRSQLKWREREA